MKTIQRMGWMIGLLAAGPLAGLAAESPPEPPVVEEAEDASGVRLSVEAANSLLATGRAAYEDGLYALAGRRLEELLAGAPDRRRETEGALWLARVRLAEQKPDEALALLTTHGSAVRAVTLQADYALARAQAHFAAGRPPEAATELEGFKDPWAGQPSAPEALRLLAAVLAAQGEWAGAREAFDRLESYHPEHPDTPAAGLELAAALAQAGRTREARTVLKQVESAHAGEVWAERAMLRLVEMQLASGERPQAMDQLQNLVVNTNLQAETRGHGYRILAQALGVESNYPAALEMVERSLAKVSDPARQVDNEILKARLLLRSGEMDEGVKLMRSVAVRIPDPVRAARLQMELADGLAQMHHWDQAATEYQAWLDAYDGAPETGRVVAGLAQALWEAARYAQAAHAFERAVARETDPARRVLLVHRQADAHFAGGQFSQAKALYEAVLAAEDLAGGENAALARLQLAHIELALGNEQAGEIRLLDLSRSRTKPAIAHAATMRLGALYEERGAFETAVEQYGRLIEACTDSEPCAEALLARGLLRYRMGAFQLALDDFTRIREELPRTVPAAQAMFMRGLCLYLLGKDAEAVETCQQFLTDYPESEFVPDVMFWLAEHAFNHGRYEVAEERFRQLADTHSGYSRATDALFWAGRAATARRAYLAANEHFNTLMARDPDSPRLAETLLAQGDVLSELGQFAAAILAFNEVIVRFPQTPEAMIAWGRKGDCQYTLGQDNPARYEEALLSYRTLLDFAGLPTDLRLQAGFKIGRCLEKMGRPPAALDRYMEVVYAFLQETRPPPEATVWFTRAAFAAAALQERAGNWREAAGIYRRVADSGASSATEASDRMDRIRREHWIHF